MQALAGGEAARTFTRAIALLRAWQSANAGVIWSSGVFSGGESLKSNKLIEFAKVVPLVGLDWADAAITAPAGKWNETSVCGNSGSQVAHQMVHLVLAVKGFYAATRADSALAFASGRFVANLALQFGLGILPQRRPWRGLGCTYCLGYDEPRRQGDIARNERFHRPSDQDDQRIASRHRYFLSSCKRCRG